jgi:two-component system nitrogen regulation response regulator NtrX
MSPEDTIDVHDLPAGLGMALGAEAAQPPEGSLLLPWDGLSLQQFKDGAEREFLLRQLAKHGDNKAATAKAIDTPRSNLYKKLDTYEINRESDGGS